MIVYYSGAIQVLGPSLWLKLMISLAPLFLYIMSVSLTASSVWQFDITSLVLHVKTWWWAKQKLLQKLCKKIFAEQHGMVGGLEAVMGAPSQFHRLRLTKRFSIVNIVIYLLMITNCLLGSCCLKEQKTEFPVNVFKNPRSALVRSFWFQQLFLTWKNNLQLQSSPPISLQRSRLWDSIRV